MSGYVRGLVSKKKRRFHEDGFDLDLTYITNNIIAMGFPSEKAEGLYRNPMTEVVRFFETRHGGHYKVYNLCSERSYDPQKFTTGKVATYAFDDHNAPPFQLIEPFCRDVEEFLGEDERNVVTIHCKAGKGRTGVMITCYLLHSKMWNVTDEALAFYGAARTKNAKGVTIPSQQRYVDYYGRCVRENLEYKQTTMFLQSIRINTIPNMQNNICCPFFTVKLYATKIYTSKAVDGVRKDQGSILLTLDKPLPVCGDVKVEFFHKKFNKKEKMFHFWFNTYFIEGNKLAINQLQTDKANKDKKHKVFKDGFGVEVSFSEEKYQGESGAKSSAAADVARLQLSDEHLEAAPTDEENLSDATEPEDDEWN